MRYSDSRPGEMRYRRAVYSWMTANAIAEKLGYTIEAVNSSLRRYEKEGICERRETDRIVAGKHVLEWRFK